MKLHNRESDSMFMRHAQDCVGNNYQMDVPGINAIKITRNVQLMRKMHYRTPVQEPIGIVDSIELINRARIVGRITGNENV